MKKVVWIIMLPFVLLTACERNVAVYKQLEYLDSLSEVQPDSAIVLLESMKPIIQTQDERIRAFYGLICVKAADKAYISHADDSLILQVVQYYEKHPDDSLTPQALYYAGRVHSDMGDAPQALDDFQKALDACKDVETKEAFHVLCVAYAQMGTLYTMQLMYDKAMIYHRLAYEANMQLCDTVGMIYNLKDLAHDYYYQMQMDSALYYYVKVERLANQYNDTLINSLVKIQKASIYSYINNPEKAIDLLNSAMPHIPDRLKSGGYSTISEAYHKVGQFDSAVHYYRMALDKGNIYAKVSATKGLAEIAISRNQTSLGNQWLNQFLIFSDSLTNYMQTESMNRVSHLYNYQLKEREKLKLEQINNQKNWLLLIFLIALILIIVFCYAMYRSFQIRKIRQRMRYVQLKHLKEYQQRRSKSIIEKEKREIKRLECMLASSERNKAEYYRQLEEKKDELASLNLHLLKLQEHEDYVSNQVKKSDIIQLVQNKCAYGKGLTSSEWELVERFIRQSYPDFLPSILDVCTLNSVEKQVCMLLKLGISPTDIATVICKEKSSVAKIRKRLYFKAFNADGKASDWDDFILSL